MEGGQDESFTMERTILAENKLSMDLTNGSLSGLKWLLWTTNGLLVPAAVICVHT